MNLFDPGSRFELGQVRYRPGATLGPRIQENLQVVHVWEGSLLVWIGGRRTGAAAGEMMILLPNHRERFQFSRTTDTYHTWCDLIGATVSDALLSRLSEVAGQPIPAGESTRSLVHLGLGYQTDPSRGSPGIAAHIGECVLLDFAAQAGVGMGTDDVTSRAAPVRRALAVIHDRYSADLTARSIAEAAGVTPQHLSQVFKADLEASPSAYLWTYRSQRAVELMERTGLSMAEIADRTGFANPFHMSRRVKELVGLSPREVRSRAWREGALADAEGRPPAPRPGRA